MPPVPIPLASRSGRSPRRGATAEEMARTQREISVAEFFAKNRHLLGYDNPSKALLTAVREAVDNALDACEEGGILPDIDVEISLARAGTRPAEEAGAQNGKSGKGKASRVARRPACSTATGWSSPTTARASCGPRSAASSASSSTARSSTASG